MQLCCFKEQFSGRRVAECLLLTLSEIMVSVKSKLIIFTFVVFIFILHGTFASPNVDLRNRENMAPEYWCDPVLGCLNLTDDWYSASRPINTLPESRAKINTRFYLHTRLAPNTNTDYIVSAEDLTSLAASPFDATKPTKFIVHGFIDNGRTQWLKDLAAELLTYGDYNVFRVDWGDGSMPMYFQAAANIRVAGLEIGYLVNTLSSSFYALDPALVHCIGHSLGSHACGYAGEQVNKLGRITGLDPAGPYFTGTQYFIHLDPTDATYVDIIHSDADSIFLLGYGTAQPFGNVDFYPNSGHDQPGCDPASIAIDMITTDDLVDATRDVFACSHIRAIKFFQETLQSASCNWIAHECYDYNSFEAGQCASCSSTNSKCAYMGIRADEYVSKSRNFAIFYLDTDKDSLFCMHHYQVSILTAYPSGAESWVMGRLFITLYGDNSEIISQLQITKDHERINHGMVKTDMFLSHQDVGHVLRVELRWVYDDNVYNPGTWCWTLFCDRSLYVQSVQVSGLSHYPETERLDFTSLVCASDGSYTEIKSGKTESFMISSNCVPVSGNL